MYEMLFQTASETLSSVGTAYAAAERSPDLAFYYLLVHEATLSAFREETPPNGAEAVHEAFLHWVESGRDVLLARLKGDTPAEGSYDDAAVALMQQLAAVSDPTGPAASV